MHHVLKRLGLAGATITLLGLPAIAAPASAATITVTTTTDGGAGSLRDAVDQANTTGGSNTIVLGAAQTYVLDLCADAVHDDDNTAGDLDMDNGVVIIQGNGSTIRQTCPDNRVLDYFAYEDDGLTLQNVTITGGREGEFDYGGGIHVDGGITLTGVTITDNTAGQYGGGLAADSGYDVTITNSTVTNNRTNEDGGGIQADYTSFTMTNSTVADNTAVGYGGGISLEFDGDSDPVNPVISHSTISGNDAGQEGGGIDSSGRVTLGMDNSTVTGNSAGAAAGGVQTYKASFYATYSTIASNDAPEGANVSVGLELSTFGTVISDPQGGGENCSIDTGNSQGYNYESGGDTCGFDDATDVADGADPQLGALAANGGPTPTRLPATTSPLVDAIPSADPDCDGDDQRGVVRPQLGGCDIGAVELEPAPEPTTTTTTTTAAAAPSAAQALVTPRFTG